MSNVDKGIAREDRLSIKSLRKTNEEVLRKDFQNEAQRKCKSYFKDFADCASQSGFLVVFKCRKQNKAMSDCMDVNFTEELFQQHLISLGYTPRNPQK